MEMDSIKEMYDIGLPILTELFNMPFDKLRDKVKEICGREVDRRNDLILKEGTVKKQSSNDVPEYIEIWCYSHIKIHAFGISYIPEHGEGSQLVEFNKFFKL
jgi:hypothetical protein